jgi:effector-binding domain-containing protein
MKMRHIVSVTFFIIISLIVYLFYHLGAYKSVSMELKEQGPFIMVYKEHIGPYHKIVPVIEEVEKWAKTQGESCVKSFGEFLDDPKSVEQERLRSHAGCLISKTISVLPEGYKIQELPKQVFLYAVFDGSPAIGPYKVYMKAANFMEEKGYMPNGSIIEVYEIFPNNKMTTEYYFKIKSKY